MKNKTFGVVGCGWLGLSIAEKWVNDGYVVHGTTTTPEKLKLLNSKGIESHFLTNQVKPEDFTWLKKLDFLLLCVPPSTLKEEYANFLVDVARRIPAEAKIIMISSTSVYANKNQIAIETDELDGTSRSAPHVIAAEKALKDLFQKRLTIIRMSGLVGKQRHPAKYMSGKEVSGGNEPVNLIHLQDCIGVIEHVIKNNSWNTSINASTPHHPSKKEYYTSITEALNIPAPQFNGKPQKGKTISNDLLINTYKYTFIHTNLYNLPFSK
ncbi:hypothetical protein CW751_01955 [Brumimicrobium salinarum]|uniref:6-phosphogluconate dehydrogenase NADP-binding domain-containing protein n=1 Tax=Brumimicrobium salinarum TaxID=2058658 RepID=A0A2I0R6C4_9FLAO|nr:NAD(P)-binding domain-containing protein [Brumimicrobium salinarum]PKR82125.1 hypothetical protein CW751_01955 [Brumimicrobium salinarum]